MKAVKSKIKTTKIVLKLTHKDFDKISRLDVMDLKECETLHNFIIKEINRLKKDSINRRIRDYDSFGFGCPIKYYPLYDTIKVKLDAHRSKKGGFTKMIIEIRKLDT